MIRYTLRCDQDHSFESWFGSVEAFEKLHAAGMLVCAVCGSSKVEKALMTPSVRPARKAGPPRAESESQELPSAQAAASNGAATGAKSKGGETGRPLSQPQNAAEEVLEAMRRVVEENSDYVGGNFAAEARAMHAGEKPERSIHGEAPLEEAKALLEEGIPVTALPILPKRKRN
ncbi:hypothetical protein CKO11_02115 [Rhodobacter sp. TJ_12]|uniref:DUF1178 family protein n=1 Tax=Rhodobacter sp. TJ_12 TaxID=2029399 RepID=UPI001CC187AE|nr:DUF1178 family protein [Rhodobacter sp. TJ_12]MBZ4021259.1 hypothetical protein [Rhodobacter sp. TJ_12]